MVKTPDIAGLMDMGKTGEPLVLTGVVVVGWQVRFERFATMFLEGGH